LIREVGRVEAQQRSVGAGSNKQATLILAALNIATEHIELKRKQTDFVESISQRADAIIKMMEAQVSEGCVGGGIRGRCDGC